MKSTILVLLLLLGAFLIVAPGAAVADQDGDYIYTTSGSGATITGYAGAGGAVTIPSTLGGIRQWPSMTLRSSTTTP